jgi:hypothetical protein
MPSGHVKGVSDIIQGKSSGSVFDSVMNIAGDGAAGWGAGNVYNSFSATGVAPGTSNSKCCHNFHEKLSHL